MPRMPLTNFWIELLSLASSADGPPAAPAGTTTWALSVNPVLLVLTELAVLLWATVPLPDVPEPDTESDRSDRPPAVGY